MAYPAYAQAGGDLQRVVGSRGRPLPAPLRFAPSKSLGVECGESLRSPVLVLTEKRRAGRAEKDGRQRAAQIAVHLGRIRRDRHSQDQEGQNAHANHHRDPRTVDHFASSSLIRSRRPACFEFARSSGVATKPCRRAWPVRAVGRAKPCELAGLPGSRRRGEGARAEPLGYRWVSVPGQACSSAGYHVLAAPTHVARRPS